MLEKDPQASPGDSGLSLSSAGAGAARSPTHQAGAARAPLGSTAGSRCGLTKAKPRLADLIEFFEETAQRVNRRKPGYNLLGLEGSV